MMFSWGTQGDWPGALWGVITSTWTRSGNLYFAEVDNGRAQKFRPRHNADPAQIIGQAECLIHRITTKLRKRYWSLRERLKSRSQANARFSDLVRWLT